MQTPGSRPGTPKGNSNYEILLVKIFKLKQKNNQIHPATKEKNNFYLFKNLLSELVQINCVSPDRVKNVLEGSFFTWNDLVLAAKSSKEGTPNHFWQMLSFLRHFSIGQSFTSYGRPFYPNWFKQTVPLLKGWPMS